jgi:glutamate N-acetyltransferase/amino-acid N-acetyltransferase
MVKLEALVVNAGFANAFTGAKGKKINKSISSNVKKILKCNEKDIFICSTGVIGEQIPLRPTNKSIAQSLRNSSSNWKDCSKAITTTDTFPKASGRKIMIDDQEISLAGIAKGSGMISPNMATMLAFIFTDAAIDNRVLQTLLNLELRNSFNAITVDGDTSTNDTVLVFATGQAMKENGGKVISRTGDPRLIQFRQAFSEIMHDLAIQIVRDGEGATKLIHVKVSGAENSSSAKKIARSVADSPLVKTAVGAADPNWGRIIMAIGKTKESIQPKKISLKIGKNLILRDGEVSRSYSETKTKKYMKGDEILVDINLGIGKGDSDIWTCDLTEGYVQINSDYRS